MPSKTDIRITFLCEFKRGTNATRTAHNINEAFGENLVNSTTVQRWFKKFREGNKSFENKDRGKPTPTVNNDELKNVIEADFRQTVIEEQKRPFLEKTVTYNKKWILYDNRNRNGHWLDKKKFPKQFPKPQITLKKIMVSIWWSWDVILHYEFMKPGETVNSQLYCSQLEKVHKKLSKKRPSFINRKGPILLHDNARPYVSKNTLQKLNELKFETLPHSPYSPDLAPTDFYFFKHLDLFLKEKVFKNDEDIKFAFEDFIASREPNFYSNGINKIVSRWERCVLSNGSYFK
uniref:Histone-lysine N-methyltransferase SETMAR (inferred by orthology to a human protein) n=1 Tax=Strongyloides venezuelensis TaxID=75913 RepID=A0A0K0FRR1_STRVS